MRWVAVVSAMLLLALPATLRRRCRRVLTATGPYSYAALATLARRFWSARSREPLGYGPAGEKQIGRWQQWTRKPGDGSKAWNGKRLRAAVLALQRKQAVGKQGITALPAPTTVVLSTTTTHFQQARSVLLRSLPTMTGASKES
jgi:hypothetical protein